MQRFLCVAVLSVMALAPAKAQDKVEVKVVKYDGLAETIKQLKGKIVVVDFWADT